MSGLTGMGQALSPGCELATLAGGCFWGVQAVFDQVRGLRALEAGYAGGHALAPSYAQVCAGDTGHVQVVRMAFDPAVVSYRQLLAIFFAMHDPTSLDRQGNDVGAHYRSVVFVHSPQQMDVAQQVIGEVQCQWGRPVVTQVLPVSSYFPAELAHQDYFRHHPATGYCAVVVAPKVQRVRRLFAPLCKTGA